jgi:hypothetical protein
MSLTDERPSMSSVNSISENTKASSLGTVNNTQKESIMYTTSFSKLNSLQKLIQKQAGLKDLCNLYFFIYF